MFLKNKNIILKIRRSKFTDYAALNLLTALTDQNKKKNKFKLSNDKELLQSKQ